MLGNKFKDSELLFLGFDESIDWSMYSKKATACLIAANDVIDDLLINSIVLGALGVGCKFFLTWGSLADELHDRIDLFLESGPDEWLSASTVSMKGEGAEDVSTFLFVAALTGTGEKRYVVFSDHSFGDISSKIRLPLD